MSNKKTAARDRVRAMREEQARRERRREQTLRLGIVVAVLIAVAIVAFAIVQNQAASADRDAVPQGITEPAGPIVVGDSEAPVTVTEWLDFQCPHCGSFEATLGDTIREQLDAGTIKMEYHPVSFLGQPSQRAANAFGCSADAGEPQTYLETLFANQPAEGAGGFTEDDLVAFGEQAGITSAEFEQCVRDGTYDGWVDRVLEDMREQNVTSTPTVFINGEKYEGNVAVEPFRTAIEEAAGAAQQ